MYELNHIYNFLKNQAPLELCESWDNSGLLINAKQEIEKALLTLDVTDAVVEEAINGGYHLIISHHPVIFKPIKSICSTDIIFKLIKNNISVISMHTNLDAAQNGVNDVLAQIIGLKEVETFAEIGRKGIVKSITVKELAIQLKEKLNAQVKYILPNKKIETIAVIGGSAGSYWKNAKAEKVDVFITGECSHHDACDAIHDNVAIITAGHWATESPVLQQLKKDLYYRFPTLICDISKTDRNPFEYL